MIYDFFLAPVERLTLSAERRKLVGQASGRVLEVGIGTGMNMSYYPVAASSVHGIDPDGSLLKRARRRQKQLATRMPTPITLTQASAETLPFESESFDTVLATLVFCSVDNPKLAIAEVLRVLRPGGLLLTMEHVRHAHLRVGRFLDLLSPAWERITGGCHLNRTPESVLKEAGFEFLESRTLWKGFGRVYVVRKPGPSQMP